MVLRLDKSDILKTGIEEDTLEMSIDASNIQKISYMLSKGFYSKPRYAICQELCSNMVDAYIEAGLSIMDNPAYVILSENNIAFRDFGIGISKDRMTNIMSKFFATTKANRDDLLGTFGLGFKSIFAYTSQFLITSVFENTRRTWVFSKNGEGFNQIDLLSEEHTPEENNTIFSFSITGDADKWRQDIKSVLKYFRGIVFEDTMQREDSDRFNAIPLIEGEHFFYRKSEFFTYTDYIEICIDQVRYKVSCSDINLSLSTYRSHRNRLPEFPFALKFSIRDGIVPTPNRESIILNNSSIEKIEKKIAAVAAELHKYHCITNDLLDYYSNPNSIEFTFGSERVPMNNHLINQFTDKKFINLPEVLQEVPCITELKHSFTRPFKVLGKITTRGIRRKDFNYISILTGLQKIICNETSQDVARYLRERYPEHLWVKHIANKLWGLDGLYEVLNLKAIKRDRWRPIIEEWTKQQDIIKNSFKVFNKEDFISFNRNLKESNKKKTRTKIYMISWEKDIMKRKPLTFEFYSDLNFVYADVNESLDLMHSISKISYPRVVFLQGKSTDFPNLKNIIHIHDFVKSKSFKRYISKIFLYNKILFKIGRPHSMTCNYHKWLYKEIEDLNLDRYYYRIPETLEVFANSWTIEYGDRLIEYYSKVSRGKYEILMEVYRKKIDRLTKQVEKYKKRKR